MWDHASTSPHGIGFVVALLGLLILPFWVRAARTRVRFGRKRWGMAAIGAAVLVLLGLFGSGVYGMASRQLLSSPMLTQRLLVQSSSSQQLLAAEQAALEIALSDRFIRHHYSLEGEVPLFSGEQIRERLTVTETSGAGLTRMGMSITPEPPPTATFLVAEYYDVTNFGFYLLGWNETERRQRGDYSQQFVHHLDELTLLEVVKAATTDDERIEALRQLRVGVTTHAEWVLRDLRALTTEEVSPRFQESIDETIAYVQRYVS